MSPYVSYMCIEAKIAVHKFFTNERGEVNVVAIVMLIAVAVVLALFFKDQITTLLETLLGKVSQKAESVLD